MLKKPMLAAGQQRHARTRAGGRAEAPATCGAAVPLAPPLSAGARSGGGLLPPRTGWPGSAAARRWLLAPPPPRAHKNAQADFRPVQKQNRKPDALLGRAVLLPVLRLATRAWQGAPGGMEPALEAPARTRKPYTITKQRECWTEEEHARFLEALRLHGRAWRRIEGAARTLACVGARGAACGAGGLGWQRARARVGARA
jgi:hypothetical protein